MGIKEEGKKLQKLFKIFFVDNLIVQMENLNPEYHKHINS